MTAFAYSIALALTPLLYRSICWYFSTAYARKRLFYDYMVVYIVLVCVEGASPKCQTIETGFHNFIQQLLVPLCVLNLNARYLNVTDNMFEFIFFSVESMRWSLHRGGYFHFALYTAN